MFCRLAFEKHPAAPASLPVPDGTALLVSQARRVETSVREGEPLGIVARRDREAKRRADIGRIKRKAGVGGAAGVEAWTPRVVKKRRKGTPVRALLVGHNGSVMTQCL